MRMLIMQNAQDILSTIVGKTMDNTLVYWLKNGVDRECMYVYVCLCVLIGENEVEEKKKRNIDWVLIIIAISDDENTFFNR